MVKIIWRDVRFELQHWFFCLNEIVSVVQKKTNSAKSWAGMSEKLFLLQLRWNWQRINQIYRVPASKLLPAVCLELTSFLSWHWRLTWWWSNIFQDMVPTVQPIFSNREPTSIFFLEPGTQRLLFQVPAVELGKEKLKFPWESGQSL